MFNEQRSYIKWDVDLNDLGWLKQFSSVFL